MERCSAIIVDLDDTLYPERDFVRSGFRAAAQWLAASRDVDAEECRAGLVALFDRGILERTFDAWLAQAGMATDVLAGMIQAYRDHIPDITPYPDVLPFFDDCRHRGLTLGLLTDGYLEVQKRKVEALKIAPRFTSMVFSDAFGRDCWKPSSVPFAAAVRQLGVAAASAIYIGDNPAKDFLGARDSGLTSIRIRRRDGVHRDREPLGPRDVPDAEVDSLSQVPDVLHALQML